MHLLTLLIAVGLPVLSGPDARLQVSFGTEGNQLSYSVAYDGKTLVAPSRLGLQTNEADYTRLDVVSVDTEAVRDTYVLDRIKASRIDHAALRAVLHCANPDGRKIDIEWHLTDHDAAFRYLLPREGETGSVRVLAESSAFQLPEGTTGFLTPQSDAMTGWKRSKPSYEEFYSFDAPLDRRSQYGHGYTFPGLFRVGEDGWVLVSETGVDSRYCASHLSDYDPATGYTVAFPMPEENNGNGTVEPAFSLPGATPWRTLTVGADLAPIVETTIAFDVVRPRYETTRGYRYGKSSWSWIVWQDASMNHDDQVAYIDLAAAMGWPYILIDAGWDQEFGHEGMAELVAYARSVGVDVFLWYSSSGWWNDIVQSPVNVMCDPLARKPEMRWMESIGVKGIKVDFFGGDKQETIRLYEAILSDADDHGLMCIFHGATLPRGWERMYPNYVGSEAVLASENMIFGQNHCDLESKYAALHPFLRNTVGCMEFGGVFLNKRLNRANGAPGPGGRVFGTQRRTTDAAELAVAVLYQNPIQNFALTPNNLTDAPAAALDFLREVPTTWDETRLIDGYPGRNIVLARRHGATWYVAAINAADEPLTLDVRAIEARLGGTASVLSTGKDGLQRAAAAKKPLRIPKDDGAVLVIR
ncbi:MAG: glycoside hydrolase family 97 catalytic domain-containing protein [Bacteroidales bacterium]|nr:glycoside hydrolase family 97 catalytic domain-containing protein [Bacteroidales bacterium]